MRRIWKITFDLASLGYSDVVDHLSKIQEQRDTFIHGPPQSIDDAFATSGVEKLKREHEGKMAVYNHRIVYRCLRELVRSPPAIRDNE